VPKLAEALVSMRVLLVEDNFIIALDLAGLVREAGAEPVGPVASVRDGMAAIEAGGIDAAILDINLGEENALALADELDSRAIPFAFATGYSPDDILPPERAEVPVLAKPYSATEVRDILVVLGGSTA
jgi:DNA-binding LytR/AlgR family response regulator